MAKQVDPSLTCYKSNTDLLMLVMNCREDSNRTMSCQEFLISVLKNHRLAKISRPFTIYYWVRGRDRRKLRQEGGLWNDHRLSVHSVDSNLESKFASTWLFRNSLFIKRWLIPFKSNDPQLHATVHWIKHRVTFVVASPQTSFGVCLSRIHFSPRNECVTN